MNQEIKSLKEAENQWENDINMYKKFLRGKTQNFEGKYGVEKYISINEK